jgi:hypothetical protein
MHHFKIPEEKKMPWLLAYKTAVEEGISYQRQSCQTLIGKKVKGKDEKSVFV